MELKDRIKALRRETGISAPALAEKLGKAESTVRTWETGRAKPDADTLIVLAGVFDCSTDYLLGISNFQNHDKAISHEKQQEAFLAQISEIADADDSAKLVESFVNVLRTYKSLHDLTSSEEWVAMKDNPLSLPEEVLVRYVSTIHRLSLLIGVGVKTLETAHYNERINRHKENNKQEQYEVSTAVHSFFTNAKSQAIDVHECFWRLLTDEIYSILPMSDIPIMNMLEYLAAHYSKTSNKEVSENAKKNQHND